MNKLCKYMMAAACAATVLMPQSQAAVIGANTQGAADGAKRPVIGLVLSGGGARGFAHIGALKALEELRVPVDLVTATSMGAMVGGSFAAGFNAEQIEKLTLSVDWKRMFSPNPDRAQWSARLKDDDRRGLLRAELGIGVKGVKMGTGLVPTQELDIFLQSANQPVNTVNDLTQLSIPYASMATDLITGERVVMCRGVTLSKAMRASMSVPGAFSPVEHEGKMLADGGLVDNLPVAEARKMGAERIFAINVGTPLSGREALSDVVGVMGQVINILTEQNVRNSIAQIRPDDILLTPKLEDYSSGDFNRAAQIIQIGYDAVMEHKGYFEAYRVSDEVYAKWAAARQSHVNSSPDHFIADVKVEGLKQVNPEAVISEINIQKNTEVSNQEIADSARHMWADGNFGTVSYHFEPGPDKTEVLVFEPTEKDWGYSSVRIGGNLQSDAGGYSEFNVYLAHTWGWLNSWGGEWRNELWGGETKKISTEFYQPLGAGSKWYLMPRISFAREPYDVYQGSDTQLARYRVDTFESSLTAGYEIGRLGRAYFSSGWTDVRSKIQVGIFEPNVRNSTAFTEAGVTFDTMDNANFPRKGFYLEGKVRRFFDERYDTDGDEERHYMYSIAAAKPIALGRDAAVLLTGALGSSTEDDAFRVGGVFSLSGSPYGRYTGRRFAGARVIGYWSVSRALQEIDMPVYVGVSAESVRLWDAPVSFFDEGTIRKSAASIFVGVDSWVGPMYLMAGRTFGDGNAVMFYWGRLAQTLQ